MTAQVRFYNPREASPEVLEAMLVGREVIVQEILDDLARQASSASRQHWLVRGPRGIGKTHLVAILYHRVHASLSLDQAYLPVWLPEAEAYSVYSAGILLLQIAQQLAVELDSAELEKKIEQIDSGGDDPALFEEMAELLRQEAEKRGKILLVLMENLDALLTGFPARRSAQEAQRLRSLLSQNREILFLSTTPTRYLAELSDPRKPLYGQLKERSLQPLTEEEVGQLLQGLTRVTSLSPEEVILDQNQQGRLRRRVLHRLTGGNPRALVMAFSVLSGTPGVRGMVEEMSALLDVQTAYFEARLAKLAPRERAIVTAMALSRENLTLQEVAQLTRLPFRSLSTQVERLIEQGYVGSVDGEGGKGAIYELSDGLFRLWYQYRKGRKMLEPIVRFLALWHPAEELEKSLMELRATLPASASVIERDLIKITTLQIEAALTLALSRSGQEDRAKLWQECAAELAETGKSEATKGLDEVVALIASGLTLNAVTEQLETLLEQQQKILESHPFATMDSMIHATTIGLTLLALRRPEEAIKILEERLLQEKATANDGFRIFFGTMRCILANAMSMIGKHSKALNILKDVLDGEIFPEALLLKVFSFVIFNSDATNAQDIDELHQRFRTRMPRIFSAPQDEALRETILIMQESSWLTRIQQDKFDEAEYYISEWIAAIASEPRKHLDVLRVALPLMIAVYPLARTQAWVEALEASQVSEVTETARLYRSVIEVLRASEPKTAATRRGSTTRIRRALARVPPELRQSVKEAVDEIQEMRVA